MNLKRKKWISIAAALLLAAVQLCACGSAAGGQSVETSSGNVNGSQQEPYRIIATIFPEYDWVMNVLGDNPAGVEVTLLLDKGVDLHSFQPSVDDIMKVTTCDMLIYAGGESDDWVGDILKEAANQNMRQLNLIEILGDQAKTEELVEGMEGHDHDHDHEGENHEHGEEAHEDETHDHEHADHDEEYDEHVWLSLRNAEIFVRKIAEELSGLDPENAGLYQENAESYCADLKALDEEYVRAVSEAEKKTLLFGDRFPFRYLTDDYGLEYYAAFAGCSAETEASFETVAFLAQKTDELGLGTVLTIDGSDRRIAETIISATKEKNQQILTLDSMQSATGKDAETGSDYLSIMRSNLEVLKQALQ